MDPTKSLEREALDVSPSFMPHISECLFSFVIAVFFGLAFSRVSLSYAGIKNPAGRVWQRASLTDSDDNRMSRESM